MTPARRVSLRELHERTGSLIREAAAAGYSVVVTDRGQPVATITPFHEESERRGFGNRTLLPAFAVLDQRVRKGDSSLGVSADRDET